MMFMCELSLMTNSTDLVNQRGHTHHAALVKYHGKIERS